jgi:hypothetical protein
MPAAEFRPFRAEEFTHDPGTQFNVGFRSRTFDRGAANISEVMKSEGEPQARIAWKPIQSAPGKGHEKRIDEEIVNADVT